MMATQHITYCPDTLAFIAEVEQVAPEMVHDNEGDISIATLTKIPTRRNGTETMSVVKGLPEVLQTLASLEILGTITGAPYESVAEFVSPAAQATYERMTGVLEPIIDGGGIEHQKPYIIGVVG